MKIQNLLEMIEELDTICTQMNSLDYSKPEEDSLIVSNMSKLDGMHAQLTGIPQMTNPQSRVYLQ